MATIKEEEMAAKNDCQYVRALDANGNSIRISKEDLAKVLGELIGIDKALKADGVFLNSTKDMNKIRQGIYTFAPESGYPANFPYSEGRGVVISYNTPPHICQIVYSFSGDWVKSFARLSYDSGAHWYKWLGL